MLISKNPIETILDFWIALQVSHGSVENTQSLDTKIVE